jgi:crotonobetainyl-CoA:carnitine CoA-transferase CaiB-like acyl-CoA transferase
MRERASQGPGALDGIKVLEAGLLVQGPQAAALLAQLGADVTKVELPGFGDQARWLPMSPTDRRSPFFLGCNRGKRSVTIDIRTDAGRDVVRLLAATADVLITNFKPGTMETWGLGYDDLAAANPRLVYATGSAFGPVGPDAEREGADLSAQASGGLISATGADGGEPTTVAVTIADHISSLNMVSGILAALLARERTGRGQRVDVSLLGSQIWAQASEYTHYLASGELPGRPNRGHPLIPGLYGIMPTADGWIAIVGVVGPNRPVFYEAIGRPDLTDDPRFASLILTKSQKAGLFAELATVFVTRTTAEWSSILRAAGQRYAPVRTYAEVADDPQVWVNGYLAEVDGERVVGMPIRLSDTPTVVGTAPPELGADTMDVLLEAGMTSEEIAELFASGAL